MVIKTGLTVKVARKRMGNVWIRIVPLKVLLRQVFDVGAEVTNKLGTCVGD